MKDHRIVSLCGIGLCQDSHATSAPIIECSAGINQKENGAEGQTTRWSARRASCSTTLVGVHCHVFRAFDDPVGLEKSAPSTPSPQSGAPSAAHPRFDSLHLPLQTGTPSEQGRNRYRQSRSPFTSPLLPGTLILALIF
jgi:hypothetical protein